MAMISREAFLAQQTARENRQTNNENKVGFLKIDNGGEAVVRFAYNNPNQFDIVTFHQVTESGKPEYQGKRYNCRRESFADPIDTCPLCASGVKLQQKFFIKMIEYSMGEDGKIVAEPKIWERSTSWVNKIAGLFVEYGDISDCVFKIKRTGTGLDTRYSDPMLANPTIYNANLYPKDFSAFENYKIVGGIVSDKLPEDTPTTETTTPVVEQAAAPRRVTY